MNRPCAYCKTEIDAQALVCPHCLREQPLSPGQFFKQRLGFQHIIVIAAGLWLFLYLMLRGN
jgi:hypothetical protein